MVSSQSSPESGYVTVTSVERLTQTFLLNSLNFSGSRKNSAALNV